MKKKQAGFGSGVRRPPVMADEAGDIAGALKNVGKRTRKNAQSSRARTSRAAQSREGAALHPGSDTPWTPPTSLEAPPERPGYRQKWLRVAVFGVDDARNIARKFREGWLPRAVSTVPKGFHMPTIRSGQFAGCIGVEGMILAEIPLKKAQKRNAHYSGLAAKMAAEIEKNIERINRAVPQHAGFGRVTKATSTRVLTHAMGEIEESP
jgi:hypothetical protein